MKKKIRIRLTYCHFLEAPPNFAWVVERNITWPEWMAFYIVALNEWQAKQNAFTTDV